MDKNLPAILSALVLSVGAGLPVFADESNFCLIPVRAVSVVVGTPIAVTREIPHNYKVLLDQYNDDNMSWKIMGAFSSIPVAVVAGTIKGCIGGAKHALTNKPFSKDAFSLGVLDE